MTKLEEYIALVGPDKGKVFVLYNDAKLKAEGTVLCCPIEGGPFRDFRPGELEACGES